MLVAEAAADNQKHMKAVHIHDDIYNFCNLDLEL